MYEDYIKYYRSNSYSSDRHTISDNNVNSVNRYRSYYHCCTRSISANNWVLYTEIYTRRINRRSNRLQH